MNSIEGKRGMPTLRPPFPAERGLWGAPTNINNVETYGNVPYILRKGGAEYAKLGTAKSKGTKVFALAGKIKHGGMIEVPMGITLREVIFEVGGGIAGDKKFKAVQMGGPSGGCIPESLLDVQVDYDSLTATGAIMGSGGMVVMDESTCMVDVARYFLSFTQSESCGKCTFCRMGTKRMLETLERICGGQGRMSDIDLLQELARQGAPGLPVRAGADRAQPGAHHPEVLPGGVRRAHPREALPGQAVPGPDPLPRDPGDLHGLHGLRQGLPDPGRRGGTKESAYDPPGQVHPVRPVLPGLPVRRHRGAHRPGGGRVAAIAAAAVPLEAVPQGRREGGAA